MIFWIPGSEDQSSVSSAEATLDEDVAGGGATRGRERCHGRGACRRGSSKGRGCGSRGRGSSRGCETYRGRGRGRGKGRERGRGRGVALEWQNILQRKSVLHKLCDVFHLVLCLA